MVIFFNISPSSNNLHPLQVENCDSNSQLVVDEDDNGKFRNERVKRIQEKRQSLLTRSGPSSENLTSIHLKTVPALKELK